MKRLSKRIIRGTALDPSPLTPSLFSPIEIEEAFEDSRQAAPLAFLNGTGDF